MREGLAKLNARSPLHSYLAAQPVRSIAVHTAYGASWNDRFQALMDLVR